MDYFEKKQWIRIAVCAVLVAVGVLAMTGVFSGNQLLMYDPASVNGSTVVSAEATEQGFAGDVTVHATVADNVISELTIDTPNETEGLGKRASEAEFTGQFIGKSGPFTFGADGIEALSGATVTSNAALKAINKAIGAEEPAAEEPAEEKTEAPAADTEAQPEEEAKEEPAEEPTEAPAAETEQAEISESEAEEKPAETANTETAASAGQAYGVYRSTKENAFSKVTVTASAKNGRLTDVQIASEGEEGKDLLTDTIRDEWAKAILESGSAAPDAITGATLTFSAGSVQEAMTEILEEIEGTSAEETAVNEETSAEETKAGPDEGPAEEPAAEPSQEAPAAAEAVTETAEAPVPEAAAAEAPVKQTPAYAGYRADKENQFSKVSVIAYAKNGKLISVRILSEDGAGKDLMTDEIRAAWAKAILESGSAETDAITGATLVFSAGSVHEAVREILAEMEGTSAEETAVKEEAPAEEAKAESGEDPAEEPVAEPAQEAPAKQTPAYAGYRADKENQFGKVSVIAYAKSGKLISVKILSEDGAGKDLMTDEIRTAWAKAILESGSAETDAITGATLVFSAGSVQEAVAEILERIN